VKQIGKPIHVAVGTMVIAAAFAAGVVAPNMRNLRTTRQRISNLQGDLQMLNLRVEKAMRVFEAVRNRESALARFNAAIPKRVQLGEFLEEVDRLAQDAGLKNKNVTPSEVFAQRDLGCLPIQINFSGEFSSVYEFLENVEKLPRVARVQQVELVADDESPNELNSSMTLHVYFRNS